MKHPKQTRADEELGMRCPKCGCRRAPVLYTRKTIGGIRRVRRCEHCAARFSSTERTGR